MDLGLLKTFAISIFALCLIFIGITATFNIDKNLAVYAQQENPCPQTMSIGAVYLDKQGCILPCPTSSGTQGEVPAGCPKQSSDQSGQQQQSLQPLQSSGQSIQSPAQQQQEQFTLNLNQQTSNEFSSNVQTTTYSPKPLQGTYIDNMSGLMITFPSGWNGSEGIDSDIVKTITVLKQSSPSLSNLSKNIWENSPPYIFVEISPKDLMLNSDKQLHYKNVINYDKIGSTKFCNLLSSNSFTIDSVPSKEIVNSCPFPIDPSVKELTRTIAIENGQINIAIGFIAIGESNYVKYLPDYENSIQSIKFSQ